MQNLKITVIGGGTGLSSLLLGLKKYNKNIKAIVTVTDDGGSSGRLSKAYGILPPGDIRNCLVSLAEQDTLMSKLFSYRFKGESDIAGHSFGNLFIAAMTDIFGSFEKGILEASNILAIDGDVIPVVSKKVTLCAELIDGKFVEGETNISSSKNSIKRVFLNPKGLKASSAAIDAIREADIIILGPGSLYTSVIPNLLFKNIALELSRSKAKRIFVCNIMSQPGETNEYSAETHLTVILNHIGGKYVDYMIVNNKEVPKQLLSKYKKKNSYPIVYNRMKKIFGVEQIFADVFGTNISRTAKYARHDPHKLAGVINKIAGI